MHLLRSSLIALFLAPAPMVLAPGLAHAEGPPKAPAQPQPKKGESLDDLLNSAGGGERPDGQAGEKAAPAQEEKKPTAAAPTANTAAATKNGKPADTKAAATTAAKPGETKTAAAAAAKPADATPPAAAPAAPVEAAPATDDNDTTAEAAAPRPLAAVQPTAEARRRGPYELGPLDCRVLDGAGIERILPKRIVSGEEPDLLCRVLITQPGNVVTLPHSLTVSVNVGDRETFRQTRNVRMSSVGRRALVFLIPADKISSDDPATVHLHAMLSAPATPGGGRDVSFIVESED